MYALGTKLRVLRDFTTDARSLPKALGRYRGELNDGGRTITDVSVFMNDQKLQAALQSGREMEMLTDQIAADQSTALLALEDRVRSTLGAHGDGIARDVRGRHGSSGPRPGRSRSGDLSDRREGRDGGPAYQASVTYNQRNMARLLNNTRSRGRRDQNRSPLASPDPMVHAGRDEKTAHHDVMQELAGRSGGRAFLNANDIGTALREALDE